MSQKLIHQISKQVIQESQKDALDTIMSSIASIHTFIFTSPGKVIPVLRGALKLLGLFNSPEARSVEKDVNRMIGDYKDMGTVFKKDVQSSMKGLKRLARGYEDDNPEGR